MIAAIALVTKNLGFLLLSNNALVACHSTNGATVFTFMTSLTRAGDVESAGRPSPKIAALAMTTSMDVSLCCCWRAAMAVLASVSEEESSFMVIRVLLAAFGKLERETAEARLRSRTPAITVVLGRRRRAETRPRPMPGGGHVVRLVNVGGSGRWWRWMDVGTYLW
jgi:hypothetical protein